MKEQGRRYGGVQEQGAPVMSPSPKPHPQSWDARHSWEPGNGHKEPPCYHL